MNIFQNIENAFSTRKMPIEVVEIGGDITTEKKDAMWFKNRDWREIEWDEWEKYRDAFFSFTPEAFAYYLPSILTLSLKNPDRLFLPAQALLQVLDRSPVVEYWDEFIVTRLFEFNFEEYNIIAEWIEILSDSCLIASDDTLGRAFDTIAILQNRKNFQLSRN